MFDYGPGDAPAPSDGGTCPNMGDCNGEVSDSGPCDVCDWAAEVGGWDSDDSGGCEGTGGADA